MVTYNSTAIREVEKLYEKRKQEILSSADNITVNGTKYYVSSSGSDENDGRSPENAWKTLEKVSSADLKEGDGVFFKRGDLFRGRVYAQRGVTYAAFGSGEKPKFYGWDRSLAESTLWSEYDKEHHIWKLNEKILDPGTLVFNEGEYHSVKLIPSYIKGRFVCRNDESKLFDMKEEMVRDLDIYWHFDELLTEEPSKGESFPIPKMCDKSLGDLYLRCDRGNPGEIFDSIEAVVRRVMFSVGANENVHIDNLCLKYIGHHAIASGGKLTKGLKVTNCEIGWIGGTIQHYFGTDPNYPQGGRGTVTRFGNGVEIYGSCEDYTVENCYIYQCYDAGMTHQVTTFGKKRIMKNVLYKDNLVENCVYSIEYFLEMNNGDSESYMENITICGNILRLSGYGWGQQRHNTDTPAHIKGWSYTNKASAFRIHHNIFDRAAYRMLHLVAEKQESCPEMYENTYVQNLGGMLGQYGANEEKEPEILIFDENADEKIENIFGDKNAKVYAK
ncbi:MAG: hypothetical protein IKM18_01930 [Clostridia bacterium]|nr:hypothetical protein [Clostridia bacterium]